MNSPSNVHLLIAFFGTIVITLAGIAREIGIDSSIDSTWKAILYLSIVLSLTIIAVVMVRKLSGRSRR